VVPINSENKTKFIVIDIDVYKKSSEQLVIDAINKSNLPLTVFTSKSGGYHIYLFFNVPIPVKKAKGYIEKFIRLLAIDNLCKNDNKMGLEIFPKQNTLDGDKKGSWINLPYYGEYSENQTRQYMINKGEKIDLEEAVLLIKQYKRVSVKELDDFMNNLWYKDAPPCLQSTYYLKGVNENRNNLLFSWGVYFKKVNEDDFETNLYRINQSLIEPIDEKELEKTVIASVRKKAYAYKCTEAPCINFCNKSECKKRTYGIGDGGFITDLDFGELRQIMTDPPHYEWHVNNVNLIFKTEDELLNQHIFKKICVRMLHHAPYTLKSTEWLKIVNDALANINIEKVDYQTDMSAGSVLRRHFSDFILKRAHATDIFQVTQGRVFITDGGYFFRARDFQDYVHTTKQFREIINVGLYIFLKNIQAEQMRKRVPDSKIQIRGYFISKEYFDRLEESADTIAPEVDFEPDELPEV